MDEKERIIHRFRNHDPTTFTLEMLTKEEWAVLEEHYNEQATKVANLESINKWVKLTNILSNGLLSTKEKVKIINLVLSRVPKDLK